MVEGVTVGYRLYYLGREKHIIAFDEFGASTDIDALAIAGAKAKRCGSGPWELWRRDIRIYSESGARTLPSRAHNRRPVVTLPAATYPAWTGIEPALEEILQDAIVRALMTADGVTSDDIVSVCKRVGRIASDVNPLSPTAVVEGHGPVGERTDPETA
jgi:hypothetical protein